MGGGSSNTKNKAKIGFFFLVTFTKAMKSELSRENRFVIVEWARDMDEN